MVLEFIVDKNTDIKSFLLGKDFSKRSINKLLVDRKNLFINDCAYMGDYNLRVGDKVKVLLENDTSVRPVNLPIEIVFEDEYLLVVNKPKTLAVIPTIAHYSDNLAGRVLSYFNSTNQIVGIHIVNRLDYLTSGLVIFAKSNHIQYLLSKTAIQKKYRCHVCGTFAEQFGEIDAPIDRVGTSMKRAVCENGKTAVTLYRVIASEPNVSLVDIELKTGRTHQIRVHFAHIGHPLIGDTLYGDGENEFDLCSYYLAFTLPINNKKYIFEI